MAGHFVKAAVKLFGGKQLYNLFVKTATQFVYLSYMFLFFNNCTIFPLQDAFNEFQVLEDRITYVATKVVHLGDQLETSNNRRLRGVEAQSLMKILGEFEHKAKPPLPVFTDPARVKTLVFFDALRVYAHVLMCFSSITS